MSEVTRRCQELLPVIQAGAEGKAIEASLVPGEALFPWKEVAGDTLAHVLGHYRLRIKPDPKYRPFTIEEALQHVGREVAWVGNGTRRFQLSRIAGITKRDETACVLYESGGFDYFDGLLASYRFTDDDSRCGVLVSN